MGPFLRRYLSRLEDMDDDDDEMGHLYTSLCDTRGLARTMLEDLLIFLLVFQYIISLEDWENDHVVEDNDIRKAIPNQHLHRNRELFPTPHTARDPNKVDEIESEDLQGMIRHPPNVGVVRFHHEPKSINT